jgi:TorA maturation chaperone TorD
MDTNAESSRSPDTQRPITGAIPIDADGAHTAAAETARARADMYQFFSTVYLTPPSEDLLRQLADTEFLDELSRLFGDDTVAELKSFSESTDLEQESETLNLEFMDLFAVPTGRYVVPFEDVYRGEGSSGPLLGEQAIAVIRSYREAGAEMDREIKELPTHVGVELAFMSFLCEQEAVAVIEGAVTPPERDPNADRSRYRRLQTQFLRDHLNSWFPNLSSEIQARASSPLYRGLAIMTEKFLNLDAAGLD